MYTVRNLQIPSTAVINPLYHSTVVGSLQKSLLVFTGQGPVLHSAQLQAPHGAQLWSFTGQLLVLCGVQGAQWPVLHGAQWRVLHGTIRTA